MTFNYEQSIWGKGMASLSPRSLASFRLRQALRSLEAVPAGGTVLEVGCGAGQFIRTIHHVRPDLVAQGCDISQTAITLANEEKDGVIYAVNGDTLPYGDQTLDAVVIFDVLEHVTDPLGMLKEIVRVLKPGGMLYAYVPCEGDVTSLWYWTRRLGWGGDLTKRFAGHINYFSRQSLRALYQQAGFSSITFRYSEHIISQLLMLVTYHAMARAAKRQHRDQMNGEEFFADLDSRSGSWLSVVKAIVNRLIYFESWLLQRVPSPNVHGVAKK